MKTNKLIYFNIKYKYLCLYIYYFKKMTNSSFLLPFMRVIKINMKKRAKKFKKYQVIFAQYFSCQIVYREIKYKPCKRLSQILIKKIALSLSGCWKLLLLSIDSKYASVE